MTLGTIFSHLVLLLEVYDLYTLTRFWWIAFVRRDLRAQICRAAHHPRVKPCAIGRLGARVKSYYAALTGDL